MRRQELEEVRGDDLVVVAGVVEVEPDLLEAAALLDGKAPVVAGADRGDGDKTAIGELLVV
ncbi:hypothetical protein Ahu01nite_068020 [Winogradskya humida]|uniref:Uncharacterized protein n=1 Tax=Winogradskya humida TaxID=113566 RepID=A0ABQ3ZYG8_9ACTN|nr:hypothetical protein Ahu01nite_068020 [Actinoplanes humidus]